MSKFISYAQNFEDVILWRVLGHVEGGRYIDVGAQSPDIDSVSRAFYERGWRGIHVEPTQHYSDLLRTRRPDESVLQVVVTDVPGEMRFFDVEGTGLSTLDEQIAQDHRNAGFRVSEVRVPAVTLDAVFDAVGPDEIHWLKIDVEGAEQQVVESWNGGRRPWVLVIEGTRPQSPELSHYQWEPLVLRKGYVFAYFDGLNRFYVSEEHPELMAALTCGPNVFDHFVLAPESAFCAAANAAAAERESHLHAAIGERDRVVAELAERESKAVGENVKLQSLLAEQETRRQAMEQEIMLLVEAVESCEAEFQRERRNGAEYRIELDRVHNALLAERAMVAELRASTSWRITAPMRAVSIFARHAVSAPRVLVRDVTLGAMRLILQRPRLSSLVNRIVRIVPPLHQRLRLAAGHRGMIVLQGATPLLSSVGQVGQFSGMEEDLAQLSLRGREILKQLRSNASDREV